MGNLKFHIDDTCVKCSLLALRIVLFNALPKGKIRFIIGKGLYRLWRLLFHLSRGARKMYKRGGP